MHSARKTFLATWSLLVLASPWAAAAKEEPAIPAGDAMKQLLDGNARFVEGKPSTRDVGDARRHELAGGQHPKAIVLSCSDSRVPPELLFDQGLGDLFVIRNAGNVPEPDALGSVEYAAEHLGVGLVVVLGHHGCGAVKATLAGGKPEGNIGVIVKDIAPAASAARKTGKKGAELEDAVVHENARMTAAALTRKSAVLRHLVHEKKLEIKVAVYDLETGKLELEP